MTDKMPEKMEGTFIRADLVIRKDDPVLDRVVDVLDKFVAAKAKTEEFLPERKHENMSEWLSCFIKHVNYRLSYADWERIEQALAQLQKLRGE